MRRGRCRGGGSGRKERMAQPKPDRSNISPLAGHDRKPRTVDSGHGWLVPHLISLIGYAERHGLTDVEKAL